MALTDSTPNQNAAPSDAPQAQPGMIAGAIAQQQAQQPPQQQQQPSGQPGQPAPQAGQPAAAPSAPPKPGSFFHNVSHAFAGSLLGALAGPDQPAAYAVDATGKMNPVPQKPLSAGDKLRKIATAALTGIAAGSQVPQQKSGAAAGLAGLGAGFSAERQQQQAQDQLARKQAGDDYQREQQQILMKANVAHGNAAAYQNWVHAKNEELDHDPERAKNLELGKGAEDAGLTVEYMTDAEALARRATDPQFIATHLVRPIGMKPMTDSDGNPVMSPDGTPKFVGQVMVINGMQNGEMPLTPSLVADVKKYGNLVGIGNSDNLKEGSTLPINTVIRIEGLAQQGKKQEMEGWVNPDPTKDLVYGGKDGKTQLQKNRVTGETRPWPGGEPNVKNAPAESAATVAEKNAASVKDLAETNKAKADAAMGGEKGLQPVIAYDAQGQAHIESAAVATELGHKNPMKASDKDYNDAITGTTVLNVIQNGVNNVAVTAPAAMGQGATQRAIISEALSHPENTTYDNIVRSGVMKGASQQTQDYVQSVLSLREQSLGYNKELTNTGRVSDVAVNALWNTLPSTAGDAKYVGAQLSKFQQSLDTLRQKFPAVQGVEPMGRPTTQNPTGPSGQGGPQNPQNPLSGQPQIPAGSVKVQIPGMPVGHIPQSAVKQFMQDHPNAVVSQ